MSQRRWNLEQTMENGSLAEVVAPQSVRSLMESATKQARRESQKPPRTRRLMVESIELLGQIASKLPTIRSKIKLLSTRRHHQTLSINSGQQSRWT